MKTLIIIVSLVLLASIGKKTFIRVDNTASTASVSFDSNVAILFSCQIRIVFKYSVKMLISLLKFHRFYFLSSLQIFCIAFFSCQCNITSMQFGPKSQEIQFTICSIHLYIYILIVSFVFLIVLVVQSAVIGGRCGPVCAVYCRYGNETDSRGCPICRCRSSREFVMPICRNTKTNF